MSETTIKAPCRSCHHDTKHVVVAFRETYDEQEVEDYGVISWHDTWRMLACCGCDTVTLKFDSTFSETGETKTTFYPPMSARRRPNWHSSLPKGLKDLLDEVYSALNSDNRRLAAMGARAALDILLADKIGDRGTFSQRLDQLEVQGFVGRRNKEILVAALDAGSAAAHRGFQPSAGDLGHVMDIVENVLHATYGLESAAAELRKITPARRPGPASG